MLTVILLIVLFGALAAMWVEWLIIRELETEVRNYTTWIEPIEMEETHD